MNWKFQSSAGHKPGRYKVRVAALGKVSLFQSSAGHKPGRYAQAPISNLLGFTFQSSAGHKPGRYGVLRGAAAPMQRFNPRPGINPAATRS